MRKTHFDKNIKRKMRKGFLWVHNDVIDNHNLNASDKLVYMVLARFVDEETQECYPSIKKLKKMSNLTEPTIRKALKALKENGFIEISQEVGKVNYYQLNEPTKNFTPCKKRGGTPKKEVGVPSKNRCTNNTHINNTHLTIHNIFSFWNEKKIVEHRKLTDKIKTKIESALKDYTEAEIKESISKYAEVLKNDKYFWTYKWTLPEFLQRGLTKFLEVPMDNFIKKQVKKKAFYNGNPMWFDNGKQKWFVIIDGEFKEFAGDEKDITWQYE